MPGAYPDINNLDKATVKHAKNDRDELGFYDYFIKENKEIKNFLDILNLNMICVRGNHEDHDFIDNIESKSKEDIFSIDVYKKVWVCKSGKLQKFKINNQELKFAGIGRIGDRKIDGKIRDDKIYIQDYERKEMRKLYNLNEEIDILITHDKDNSVPNPYGTTFEIREFLDNVITYFHFYGHTGEPFNQKKDKNGITISVKISEAEFTEEGILPKGSMIIFEKNEQNICSFEVVEQKLTNNLTKHNWKYIF